MLSGSCARQVRAAERVLRDQRGGVLRALASMDPEDRTWREGPPAAEPPREPGPPTAPGPELHALHDWTRYRLERFLGAGGMGSVYLAFDLTLGRHVALKFLHRNEPSQAERFLHEARAQARVEHPNVCPVYEVGEVEGRPYIAMQYVEGRSLAELGREPALAAGAALVRDVARAIHAAHRTGLIHRDLKPGNILVARGAGGELHPVVVDFGLARGEDDVLTQTGRISGTPAYASPEQVQGRALDGRTDVWSLGVVLYELATGRLPFSGPGPLGTLQSLVRDEPVPPRRLAPAVPPDLESIVLHCLEKDRARRYASARDLADDLDRFLDGEPIRARPATLLDRARKRLRKNRALAAVSAAAVAALLGAGLAAARAEWQARERAALAQRFGQRVKDLEATMRYTALLPRHDVRQDKARLRREIAAIGAEMERLGAMAEGPGHAALGRAYLALHQHDLAYAHLQRAWSAGQRGPEVATAMGRVLGARFEAALVEASRGRGGEARSAARQELGRNLLRPAIAFLREGAADAGAASPYVAGLIAFYQGRHAAAVANARRALRDTPWLYEAGQLEAEVYAAQADEARTAGGNAEAQRLYRRAAALYATLLAAAPSDAGLHAAACALEVRRLETDLLAGLPPARQAARATAVCDRALAVDPELAVAHAQKSRLHWRLGEFQARHGGDPRAELAAAVALAERAIALDPRSLHAQHDLAVAYRLRGTWEMEHGGKPSAWLKRAVAAAARAAELEPRLALGHTTLGTAHVLLATDRQRMGEDPRPELERAIASFRRALAISPRDLAAVANLGAAWKVMAEWQMTHGLDPEPAIGEAVAVLTRGTTINPRSSPLHNNLGNAHLTLGEARRARGADPLPALALAAASYRRAIAATPDYGLGHLNLGHTERCRAAALLERGADPEPALAAARRSLVEAQRINPEDADNDLERGRVELLAGHLEARRGRDPEPAFAAAADAFATAARRNPAEPEIPFARGELELRRAEWLLARGGSLQAALRRGLAAAAAALAGNPAEPRYQALRGRLLQLAAGQEDDPARRGALARSARADLERAVRTNPLLRREVGPALAALGGGG